MAPENVMVALPRREVCSPSREYAADPAWVETAIQPYGNDGGHQMDDRRVRPIRSTLTSSCVNVMTAYTVVDVCGVATTDVNMWDRSWVSHAICHTVKHVNVNEVHGSVRPVDGEAGEWVSRTGMVCPQSQRGRGFACGPVRRPMPGSWVTSMEEPLEWRWTSSGSSGSYPGRPCSSL